MVLELFKLFVMKRLVDLNDAQHQREAHGRVRARPVVGRRGCHRSTRFAEPWSDAAPRHRLRAAAGRGQGHRYDLLAARPSTRTPTATTWCHLPLSAEAQAEARAPMLEQQHPTLAHGRPTTPPTQDMVLGIYHLTGEKLVRRWRTRSSVAEVLDPHEPRSGRPAGPDQLRLDGVVRRWPGTPGRFRGRRPSRSRPCSAAPCSTRCCWLNYLFVDQLVDKKRSAPSSTTLPSVTARSRRRRDPRRAQGGGLPLGDPLRRHDLIEDVVTRREGREILEGYEEKAENVDKQYERGLTTDEMSVVRTHRLDPGHQRGAAEMEKRLPRCREDPVWMMVNSGARGNMSGASDRRYAWSRGEPKGEDILVRSSPTSARVCPSSSNFISTHGARKGLADTALRTADSVT